ncbi:MAG: shikimate dehydrogenase [Candidatus Hydrothermarchaeota archaeon]
MINGSTKIFGIIGFSLEHSLSPLMHNYVFNYMKLNCVYVPFPVKRDLKKAIIGLHELDVKGVNITIPYKEEVINYIDELDEKSRKIGSVNTIKFTDKKIGYNTDGIGAIKALKDGNIEVKGKKVMLLGAGGAARSIAFQLVFEGCSDLLILNRTKERGDKLAREIMEKADFSCKSMKLDQKILSEYIHDVDILINSTSLGMYPNVNESPVPKEILHDELVVFDIVYNPLKTKLLKEAEEMGAKTIDGLGMLVHQGAESLRIWLDIDPPIDLMKKVLLSHLK